MRLGDVIRGKYRLLRLLGDGGMGSVYEASHELLGTRVAIKVLHEDLARRTGLIERFLQEARVAAQIKSPHVVQVTDIDRTPEGQAYIVMELLEGEPLSALLDRQGKLPIPMACELTRQILEALEAAHALGVVHRDLKPENAFLTAQATPGKPLLKLIDFGIAKLKTNTPAERNLTVAGVLMGTAEYMAPEQAHSADKVDARSDLYAVGVMLYEMIAGRRPVSGEDARTIAAKVERGEVIPLVHAAPEVPRELAGLVHRAMAARPELRFASAVEMRVALDGVLTGKRPPTVPLPAPGTIATTPVHAVFTPPFVPHDPRPAAPVEASPRTERAPGPPIFASAPAATADPPARRRRGSGAWGLVLIPLVLGAAVVGVFVLNADREQAPAPAATLSASPPATLSALPTVAPLPAPAETITPLAPPQRIPPAASRPSDAGHVRGGPPAPPPVDSTFVPPFALPSSLPFPFPLDGGIPVLPFPLPSALPTAFPTALPSTLPFPIPVPEAPHPAPAPSGSSTMF